MMEDSTRESVRRLVVEKIGPRYRVLVYHRGQQHPTTIAKFRGGVRTWSQVDTVVGYLQRLFPHIGSIELQLQPSSSPALE